MTETAKQIVKIVNQTSNNYDAIEEIAKFLDDNFIKIKK